jgi:hypothetical protein
VAVGARYRICFAGSENHGLLPIGVAVGDAHMSVGSSLKTAAYFEHRATPTKAAYRRGLPSLLPIIGGPGEFVPVLGHP